VAIFAQGILEGRELIINGDGEQTRDYIFVGDVVHANLLATGASLGEEIAILNIGTGIEASVNDLAAMFRQISSRAVGWRHGPPRPGEQRRSALDSALARSRMGWESTTDLRSGLAHTFQWFQARWDAGRKTKRQP
jgi:UDP-glucose 4-epimerase